MNRPPQRLRRALALGLTVGGLLMGSLAIAVPADAMGPSARAVQARASESWLFSVQAASGSTRRLDPGPGEDERFTLVLRGASRVTMFADRPFRDAVLVSPAALVRGWNQWFSTAPPNAAVTFVDTASASQQPSSIVVILSHPRYDKGRDRLSFRATRIHRLHDPTETGDQWARVSTPKRFTSASLFIDDASCSPGANCAGMYIGGWSLIGAKFPNAIWWQVDAGNANLTGIDLSGTDARLANFANANLTGANLSNMNLSGANFAGANLTNANLSGSNFTATNFQDANMTGAIAPGATVDHTLICGAFDTTQDGFETDRALMYINDYGGLSTDDQFGEGCSFTQMWQNAFSNSSEAASTSLEIADLLAELLHVLL